MGKTPMKVPEPQSKPDTSSSLSPSAQEAITFKLEKAPAQHKAKYETNPDMLNSNVAEAALAVISSACKLQVTIAQIGQLRQTTKHAKATIASATKIASKIEQVKMSLKENSQSSYGPLSGCASGFAAASAGAISMSDSVLDSCMGEAIVLVLVKAKTGQQNHLC